ncbi:DUF6378 domain-containing protein [Rubellimicrobium sp. CFH 75288]|uniref:DUF6378 domain-containing protein n=1 Tax=Rubellimicrobium sp. CFH 75288 TaxID=2697034 RepID=UPI001412C82A|nr:DUF6378 domain-containing protein [Rubellimicrobium sp. CFH 75288]NAZ37131.1 hypothetical protein [Rubellimicrobium sp. CFH 75288]
MIREDVLREAAAAITGDRQRDYGPARESFERTAALWSAALGRRVAPEQVALMLALLKVARLCTSPDHRDSWVDLAGYAALGAEVAARDER